jgi:cysteinyl-tRNA synthetase
VSNLVKDYSPDAIRATLLSHHYRYPWECFPPDLEAATALIDLFAHIRQLVGRSAEGEDLMLRNRFKAAMDDDLNTPAALDLLRHAAKQVTEDQNLATGTEILRLTSVLGLCV